MGVVLAAGLGVIGACNPGGETPPDPLSFPFDKKYGQVEVGGPFAGAEFHGSRPLPARISFFYPVANSIDLSTDYWKRGVSQPMVIGLRRGDEAKQWVGKEAWTYVLSPHRVEFAASDRGLAYRLSYEFCQNEPALVQTFVVSNTTGAPVSLEVYTHLKTILRTCQTYARKESASTGYDPRFSAIVAEFDDPDAARASVFVQNAGEPPSSWTSDAGELGVADSGGSSWMTSPELARRLLAPGAKGVPVAAFLYRKAVAPGDSLRIIQVIGSSERGQAAARMARLASGWSEEVAAYDRFVRTSAETDASFATGDASLDRSAVWARGLLASNRHYLDGAVVPMPCPAEYNFFFTHDLLLTDLGAVNFDLPRVKRDLLYLRSLAKDDIIPHAYYWRDTGYQTEWCTPENWNHLWFIIVASRYLRHSGDAATGLELYPLVTKSLTEILSQRKGDTLMYAFRPDWWDIGRRDGPRSYITILTIRALRDYLYLSCALGRRTGPLREYENLADGMERALGERLWDDSLRYLINYNGAQKDAHIYMGSLLAPVYGVLARGKSEELIATATRSLLRPPVGVMVVSPPDFHTDAMRSFFKFVGNEAGDPYIYANGGIWPHANAQYALALIAVGRQEEALRFVKTAMTLEGVATGPNGLPAMYEYRMSDSGSADFGTIDKPSFLWAAGFYLNVLYALSGFQENEWNLSIAGARPASFARVACSYAFGRHRAVSIEGGAGGLRSLSSGESDLGSAVLPTSAMGAEALGVRFGKTTRPLLERVNAIVERVDLSPDGRRMSVRCSSFLGHRIVMSLVAPEAPALITVDGSPAALRATAPGEVGTLRLEFAFEGSDQPQDVVIEF